MQNLSKSSWIDSESSKKTFRKSLLAWFDQQQRALPWRKNPSLYKTVVSEFMLQQTRVATMLPYYEKWMKQFPDFETLANAQEGTILKAWEGLGYYSRAKNLHKLAKIVQNWNEPQKSLGEWKKLPGIGPYIAAAVTSISLRQKNAVCDGNVVRVLTRLFSLPEIFKDGATAQKKLLPIAQELICGQRPGDFNQAMMELGATICHRQSPLCTICPVLSLCKSGKEGNCTDYPKILPKEKKKQKIDRFWVEENGKLLLYTSPSGRLAGIYELPSRLPAKDASIHEDQVVLGLRKRTIGITDYEEKIILIKNHNLSASILPDEYNWVPWSEINSTTLSGPHRRWIQEMIELTPSPIKMDRRKNRNQITK